jgi:Porin subfamily
MHVQVLSMPECAVRRPPLGLWAALVVVVALTISWAADAQTLTDPNPKAPPARPATKSRAASTKGCSQYGAGFVQIAGSGACVKIGGYVTVEGSR